MKTRKIFLILFSFLALFLLSFVTVSNEGNDCVRKGSKKYAVIKELSEPNLTIKEGLISMWQDTVFIKREGKVVGKVILSEPVMVAQAEKEEPWGFFQFPSVYRTENDNIIVGWQMMEDSYTAYGKGGEGMLMSVDEGETWQPPDRSFFKKNGNVVNLRNGDILRVTAQPAKDISDYDFFPNPVSKDTIADCLFYRESDLPDDLRGNYIIHWDKSTGKTDIIHGVLNDPGLLRYAINGLMAVLWLGDIKETMDGTLVTGVYPANYLNSEGKVLHSGISFYKSTDGGYNWNKISTIPYQRGADPDTYLYDGDEGFSEPAFEILQDGTYICVMRTGLFTPMYKSLSNDDGQHWTKPEPFTPNGVDPELLQLPNGVLVLVSGRPGVQVRFNVDGDGDKWTEPIEMVPFMNEKGEYDKKMSLWPTCGYAKVIGVNDRIFYLVYSDFKTKNDEGVARKAILFRKIEVVKE